MAGIGSFPLVGSYDEVAATLQRLSGATVCAHEWEADIIAGERKAQAVPLRPARPLRTYLPTYPLQLGAALCRAAGPLAAPPAKSLQP